jgi:malate dehydrogenase
VPCVLGAAGVEKIIEVVLDDHEKKLLDHSASAVRELVETLKKV